MPDTSSWTPILEGTAAARAWDAIRDIDRALRGSPTYWGPGHSLMEGRTGAALFFAYLGNATGDDAALEHAIGLIDVTLEEMAQSTTNSGLAVGFPGVAWALEHLDGRIGEPSDQDLNADVDELLIEALSLAPTKPWPAGHDLMFGLTGLGVYAFERLPRPSGRRLLQHVVQRLDRMWDRKPQGIAWPSPQDNLPSKLKLELRDGYYNLGVAHGAPGVIGLLARACSAGVAAPRARELLRGSISFLAAQKLPDGYGSSFSSWVTPTDPHPSRSSWCYGNPGIAPCLMTAGRCCGERSWEQFGLEVALVAAARPFEEAGIVDAGLCHGAGGAGHLLNRMYQATRDERLLESARFWFDRALGMRRPGHGLGGYLTYRSDLGEAEITWKPDAGLLTGVAGAGLALLAAVTSVEPEWDRVLLASIPPSSSERRP